MVGSVCQDIDSQMVASVVLDELLYGLENFGFSEDEIADRLDFALREVGIEDLCERTLASLSGGQKQKVAIASIVALKPKVLVLDEPTAELDPQSSASVFSLLRHLIQTYGITVIVVEQKIALLSDFVDQLIVMVDGQIAFDGTPSEVLNYGEELLKLGVNCPRSTILSSILRDFGIYQGALCRNVDEAFTMACTVLDKQDRADGLLEPMRDVSKPVLVTDARNIEGTEGLSIADPIIEFCDVSAEYQPGTPIIRNASFSIERGDFIAFVGPNGAGKSTFMRLINGLLKPTEGEVIVDGLNTRYAKTSGLARKVGFLFQNPDRQICCSTIAEELAFGFKNKGVPAGEVSKRVQDYLDIFGFDGLLDPFTLNRGTRQRIALASILVLEPEILILDEPTTGLDHLECIQIMDRVRALNEQGTTIIMVCHDMELVSDYARTLYVITEGTLLIRGPVFTILREKALLEKAALLQPHMIALSERLRQRYGDINAATKANTFDEMAQALIGDSEGCITFKEGAKSCKAFSIM
jgi:energy-coupling factor transport system ATP-binding protein